jgi:ABC-type transport system involved in cytochrome bd biosynthesis fused ATPase/permease subunit
MFDSRKYCPQCGSDQLEYRTPKSAVSGLNRMFGLVIALAGLAFAVVLTFKQIPAGAVWLLILLIIVLLMFIASVRANNAFKIYRLKCRQCGHQWTMTREEWLQAGDALVQTKTLSPQEKEEKRAVVGSLINQIRKM